MVENDGRPLGRFALMVSAYRLITYCFSQDPIGISSLLNASAQDRGTPIIQESLLSVVYTLYNH